MDSLASAPQPAQPDNVVECPAPINPPPGGKKRRGRPPKDETLATLAKDAGVSLRMAERAMVVHRRGVPELQEIVRRGELKLGLAEFVARWSAQDQTEHVALGVKHLLELIPMVRIAHAEEKGRQAAGKVRACPHCGGAL